jgi:glycosyltransferase involved in cell wall biosynthesis
MIGRVRVGLSLLTLSPGISGGSETYARGLTAALAEHGTLEYIVIAPALARDAAGPLRQVDVAVPRLTGRGPSRIPALALAARRSRELRETLDTIDVLHYALTVPIPRSRLPTVVTLHDVQHRDSSKSLGAPERVFRRIAYDRAARRAARVIVPSEFTRSRAVASLGLDPERVHVVPHAADPVLFTPGEGERDRFLLYPAHAWPHKNHRTLLRAFDILRRDDPGLRLVLTGGGLERLGAVPSGVERLGIVSPERLAQLYRRASCLVFPSTYEGFGLPLIEAMTSGCPVAASRAGAIPEVCGDAAVLFDPTSHTAVASAVSAALEQAGELSARGLRQAAQYSWEESARRHELVYRLAAEQAVP